MDVSTKLDTLEELEEYYRHHFEIASLPVSQRPVNLDLLTRTERELLGYTTKIDQVLGIPSMDSKSEKTLKRSFNVNSIVNYFTKPFNSDIFFIKKISGYLIQYTMVLCNFIWNIGLTLYGPCICGIIEVFFGDTSIIHLFLLCFVVTICVILQVYTNFPLVYIILSIFPILWQAALTILPPCKNIPIPRFTERLTGNTKEKKAPTTTKSNWTESDNTRFTIKAGSSKRLAPEERAIALLKKLENDPY